MKSRSSSLWPSHIWSPGKKGDVKQTEHSGWVFVLHWTVLLQNDLSFKEKEMLCPLPLFNSWLTVAALCHHYSQYVKRDSVSWCMPIWLLLGKKQRLYKNMGIQSVRSKVVKQSLASRIKVYEHGECKLASTYILEKVTLASIV